MFKQIKNDLFKNVFTIVSGTVIAQLIPILLQPFLRRMYSPEDFGLLGVYTSIIGITTVIFTLRYSQTINIPKSDIVAANIFSLSLIIAIFLFIIFSVVIFTFSNFIMELIGIPSNRSAFLYFIPLSTLLFILFEIINFWLIRKKEFKLAALNKIYRRISEGFVNLTLGIKGNYYGLIAGDIGGNIVNVLSGVSRLKKINFSFKYVSIKRMVCVAKRFSDMPKYNLFPQLLNSMCIFLPALFINKLYSSEIAGYFNLTMLVLNIPIVFIGNSISEVLIQRLAEKKNNKLPIKHELQGITRLLAFVSVMMIIVIMLVGQWAFGFVFGHQWRISGTYAEIYVWASAVRLVASPLNITFVIFEKVKKFAIWQIGYFLFTGSLVFFGFLKFEYFLLLITFVNVLFYSIVYFMSKNIIIQYEKTVKV